MNTKNARGLQRQVHLVIMIAVLFVVCAAFAAPKVHAAEKPDSVKKVKWVSGYESIMLSWKAVSSPDGEVRYEVRKQGKKSETTVKTNLKVNKLYLLQMHFWR